MKQIYYIGGSPCSGKSTAAEVISRQCDLYYFKVDDYLDRYAAMGAAAGSPACVKLNHMTPEQLWMRAPEEQNLEELQFYREIFDFVMADIRKIPEERGIIAEGAAFLPELMMSRNIDRQHYVNVTPTPEFQVFHYRQRPFVAEVLKGCTDPEQAFRNWMDRDRLFGNTVREQAAGMGYRTFLTDESTSAEELVKQVCMQFELVL